MAMRLDFLCLTQAWLICGESSIFSELLSWDNRCLNSQWSLDQGEIATAFRNNYICEQLSRSSSFTSFEVSLFELHHSHASVVYVFSIKRFVTVFSDNMHNVYIIFEKMLGFIAHGFIATAILL